MKIYIALIYLFALYLSSCTPSEEVRLTQTVLIIKACEKNDLSSVIKHYRNGGYLDFNPQKYFNLLGTSTEILSNPLITASSYGSIRIVSFLLNEKVSVHYYDFAANSALLRAVQGNHLKIAELLLKYGASPDPLGLIRSMVTGSPLHVAVENGNIEMVRLLIKFNAKINSTNNIKQTPLSIAMRDRKFKIQKLLKDKSIK